MRLGLELVVLIWNDGKYGLIEWHQNRKFGRPSHIDFHNPDFVKYAESFGAKGYRIESADDLVPTLKQALADETVVVGAHHDHVGVGRPVDGDSIYNGADDDASGVVAVLEIARALAAGSAPSRTVVFLFSTGEELGLLGTQWYLQHPAVPLDQTVADLQVEMIGRPDSLAGGAGYAWLTGFERSTMGRLLRDGGVNVVSDPRPEMNFFMRSDNAPFAFRGIPAHTLSSYNMHEDYHSPSDEVERVDFRYMTMVIESAVRAVELLANGERVRWLPGGRPE